MTLEQQKALLKKVRQIDIRLRRRVSSALSGQYRSAFKGQGMVFSDFREYVPGDDARAISWNLTAKMSRPFVKVFEEEREAQIIIAADISGSTDFGAGERTKKEALSHLTALLAFCAQKNRDLTGLLLFAGDVELFVPPKKGSRHTFRLVREICAARRRSPLTNIPAALLFLERALKKRSHVFLFSDFLSPEPFGAAARRLGLRHDLVCAAFSDPFERDLPPLGLVEMEDLETGETVTRDLSSPFFQRHFKRQAEEKRRWRDKELLRSGADVIFISAEGDIYEPFVRFFQSRARGRAMQRK